MGAGGRRVSATAAAAATVDAAGRTRGAVGAGGAHLTPVRIFRSSTCCVLSSFSGKEMANCTVRSPYLYVRALWLYDPRRGMPSPGILMT